MSNTNRRSKEGKPHSSLMCFEITFRYLFSVILTFLQNVLLAKFSSLKAAMYKACTGVQSSLCHAVSLVNSTHTQKRVQYLRIFLRKLKLANVLLTFKCRNVTHFLESQILTLYSVLNVHMYISKQYKHLKKWLFFKKLSSGVFFQCSLCMPW